MAEKTAHIIIKGKVQGVWYRGWAVETARKLGLSGWVRNRFDRSVEMMMCGEEEIVNEMIKKCYQGPSFAKVTKIEVARDSRNVPAIQKSRFYQSSSF